MIKLIKVALAGSLLGMIGTGVSGASLQNQEPSSGFEQQFFKPSVEYRPNLNKHGISSKLPNDIQLMETKLAEGYGGFNVNVSWNSGYLHNDAEFRKFFAFCDAAKERGMNLWLYDENWYPSGMAGGIILREHPEWECEGLKFKDADVPGGSQVSLSIPPGKLLLIKAVALENGVPQLDTAIDLSGQVTNGTLIWKAPKGMWKIAAVSADTLRDGYQAGNIKGGLPKRYPSLLMPEVTQRFIELTHTAYAGHAPKPAGNYFFSTFTDEPSAMAFGTGLDHGTYPWKSNLSAEIQRKYGWCAEKTLLPLMLDKGSEGKRMRLQYFQSVADLISVNYFRAIESWCRSYGFQSGGHLLREESMLAHVPLYGNIFACYREMGIPGIDILTNDPEITLSYLYAARLAASAAELNGRNHVMLEFCPVRGEPSKEKALGIYIGAMIGGVSHFNSYYAMKELTGNERLFVNTTLARIAFAMDSGLRAADIAVFYPVETLWTEYLPKPVTGETWWSSGGITPEARAVEASFDGVSDALYNTQREFSYVDSAALVQADILDGRLHWKNGAARRVLILPCASVLPSAAWNRISEFWKNGGTVIATGSMPQNSETEFPCPVTQEQAGKIFSGIENPKGGLGLFIEKPEPAELDALLNGRISRPFTLVPEDRSILTSCRQTGDVWTVLLLNNSSRTKSVRFIWNKSGHVFECNPQTGRINAHDSAVSIELQAYEARIFRAE